LAYDWNVEIEERLICVDDCKTTKRPLRSWAQQLSRLWAEPISAERVRAMWQRAVRLILLEAVGLFGYRPKIVTRRVSGIGEVPPHDLAEQTFRQTEEGEVEYEDYASCGRMNHLLHPEFSAAVWADTRVRLMRQISVFEREPLVTGALTLPREQVVGFGLDCLYLTADPGWQDDGKPGRYRLKSYVPGVCSAPRDRRQLEELLRGR